MVSAAEDQFDVLVIGCGPVGLFSAYLLGQRGIRTLVVDKHTTRRGQPKAHAVNPRTLEIFKQVGLDVAHIRAAGLDPQKVDVVRFVSSFYGWEFGNLLYERQFPDVTDLTPEPLVNIAQPLIEEYLAQEVSQLPSVTIRKETEWIDAEEAAEQSVLSTLLNRQTGTEYSVQTPYLIACDGARATSRAKLSISFNYIPGAESPEKNHVTTHFRAALPGKRSGILFFNMQPHGVRAFIRYGEDEWVFVRRFDPAITDAATFNEAMCRQMIIDALGKETELDILSITIWSSVTKVADTYRSKRIRGAFLAGDAAHTFPPTGGLGVNTGFVDVHNLVWKLDAVMHDIAPDELLDSYEVERRPVAVQNAKQSAVNEVNMDKLGSTINPHSVQEQGTITDWTDATFQKNVQEAIQLNAEHFDSLGLQLGFVYGSADAVREVSVYRPQVQRGARLPHAYVSVAGVEKSILDLIDSVSFTLLCPTKMMWEDLRSALSLELAKLVKEVILGVDFTVDNEKWVERVFASNREKALLVRPDQHIVGFVDSVSALDDRLRTVLKIV